ncbi:L2 protein [Phocoena phocoena papillomavirus 4]|uniref:Minor capsid protein L2 n=1 Tax=Phocoena phocoena papillomavirus 4 TaxID=706527 RepID=F2VIR8_9PAPI|nr:L2 protein [Phocoena phocoena papillomavirus 4]ADJ96357.1 L2 protein [Phocoena phocoena papillomavirus 4]
MARPKRVKRASAESLYRTCKAAGTCPPDVVKKIEGSTIADKILQYGSLGVYLGGLGIGTGSGTGGRTGYVPLRGGSGGGVAGGRPTTIGPIELPKPPAIALEETVVTASDPSIIPLVEISSDTQPTVIGGNGGGPVTVTPDIPIITHNTPDVTVAGPDAPPAVLDIGPTTSNGARVRVAQSEFHNPVYYEGQGENVGEASDSIHTLIRGGASSSANSAFSESIELQTFSPKSSTPLSSVIRGQTALKLYSKGLTQVNVANTNFLHDPRSLFTFDNPAFNIEDTLDFDPEDAAAVSDPQFLDIVKLHRPALTTTRRGAVRLSRIGQKQSMTTRSGKRIGARIHFFKDLSSIHPVEGDIEMQDLSVPPDSFEDEAYTGPSIPGNGIEEVFDIFTGSPSTPLEYSRQSISINGSTISLDFPHTQGVQTLYPPFTTHTAITPGQPISPAFWNMSYSTFYLHPGYLARKRKRKVLT